MKTSIYISGQISGNFTLRNAIITAECEEKKEFNNMRLIFPTKKAARKALWDAYKSLRSNYPEMVGGLTGLRYSKLGGLYWDASKAEIV